MKTKIVTKYYKVKINCPNCRKWNTIEIPLGMSVVNYLKNNTCENCGCTFCKSAAQFKRMYHTIIGT